MKATGKKLLTGAGTVTGLAGLTLFSVGVAAPQLAGAQTSAGTTYMATLKPVPHNGATGASGTLTLTLNGDSATIKEHVTGLAATFTGKPYPHVQHIHGLAKGVCPTTATPTRTGVISTKDALPTYGPIQTTLALTPGGTTATKGTTVTIAPKGTSFTYSRTITLNATTMKAIQTHNAVIVVHGLTPKTAPPAATSLKSTLVPSLPLAATSPALCGPLTASQMTGVPTGGAATGGGSTAGVQNMYLFAAGGGLLAAGGALLAARRRMQNA